MEKKKNINLKVDPNIIKQREREKTVNFKIDRNIIRHFDISILTPEKYLSVNPSFCEGSVI